jgi:transporter family-2 protein
MTQLLPVAMVVAVAGFAAACQGQFMGLLGKGIGTMESVFICYVVGAIVIGLSMVFFRGGNLMAWNNVPWYSLTAGVMGLIIVGAIAYSVPRVGLVATSTIFVASQFTLAAMIDNFGLFGAPVRPIDLSTLVGIAVLLLGVWLIVR